MSSERRPSGYDGRILLAVLVAAIAIAACRDWKNFRAGARPMGREFHFTDDPLMP